MKEKIDYDIIQLYVKSCASMCTFFQGKEYNWNVLYEKIDKNWELPMKFKWQILRVENFLIFKYINILTHYLLNIKYIKCFFSVAKLNFKYIHVSK